MESLGVARRMQLVFLHLIEIIPNLWWEFFIFSIDDCDGTGDHENYFKDITDAYEVDGTKYTNCRKKAVSYRSKYQHEPLSRLIENDFLLLNRVTGHYSYLFQQELLDNKEILDPKFSWVFIYISFLFELLDCQSDGNPYWVCDHGLNHLSEFDELIRLSPSECLSQGPKL